jgi:hypothetical protein
MGILRDWAGCIRALKFKAVMVLTRLVDDNIFTPFGGHN